MMIQVQIILALLSGAATLGETACKNPANCPPDTHCRGACIHSNGEELCVGQCADNTPLCEDRYGRCQGWLHMCTNTMVARVCVKSCGLCDTLGAPCPNNTFRCDGECQSYQLLCDGIKDCVDRADEEGCNYFPEFWLKPGRDRRRCGVRAHTAVATSRRSKRLIGAKYAKPHSWPWLGFLANHRDRTLCGATLIHPEWAVTAAHCLHSPENRVKEEIYVSFGRHSIRDDASSEILTRQRRNVTRIITYPSFHYDNIYDDIAIVKLSTPVVLNDFVNVICMPLPSDFAAYRHAGGVAAGWGEEESSNSPRGLKQVVMRDAGSCVHNMQPALLCAEKWGSGVGGKCSGDSGSPLVGRRITGSYTFLGVGVFTTHKNCSAVGVASGYNNVSHYLPWIRRYVPQLEYF